MDRTEQMDYIDYLIDQIHELASEGRFEEAESLMTVVKSRQKAQEQTYALV